MAPVRRLDHKALAELLGDVWPDLPLRALSVEKVHTGRSSDHYRVHHAERSMIVRAAPKGEGVARHLSALQALSSERFTPDLLGELEASGKQHLIALEDLGGRPMTAPEVEQRIDELVDIVRGVHEHMGLRRAVSDIGMDEPSSDDPPAWFEASLAFLRENASGDERLAKAERWLARHSERPSASDLMNSVLVCGHGDLHRDNWLLTQRGIALIDWEDIGRVPLADELASLIVFGHLPPRAVAEMYGVSDEYVEAVERSTASHALYLYVYWLRKLIEEEDVDEFDVAYAEATCERYFG